MQKLSKTLPRMLLAASLSMLVCNVTAENSATDFEKALQDAGWSVEREADGSLILTPQSPSEKRVKQGTKAQDQWPQLKSELQAAGWSVSRDTDGSLILMPPEKTTVVIEETVADEISSDETSTTETDTHKDSGDEILSFDSMQQRLRDAGWSVINSPDGSILLYPPGESAPEKITPCPGTPTSANITLPVNTWLEAHAITQGWLNDHPTVQGSVGKIRSILGIYLVSIVSKQAPHSLMHQIAIRNSDGTTILLN